MPFALYMLALAVFVMGTSEFMLAGLLPAIATELDVSIGTAGLLTSAFAVGMVIGAPVMAAFARPWPPRLTLIVCLLVFAGSHVIGALTSVFSLLFITRVLSALANAGFLAVALSTATTVAPATQKGRALSILLSGTTIATVAGVPAGAALGTAMGWRMTFCAIAILCIPAAVGVICGFTINVGRSATSASSPRLRTELSQLATPRLILAMALGALINGGTFAALTFLAPVVTETAGLADGWVSVALVMFGIGSFLGVTIAGRLSDRRPGLILAVGGPILLTGWIVLAVVASHPVALIVLVLVQGFLSFGVGSTLITRVLYAASGAPTMGGSYATAALNIGGAAGAALGAFGLATGLGLLAPVWVASVLTAIALVIMLLKGRAHEDRGGRQLVTHPRALLTPRTRLRFARLIVEDGYPATIAAKNFMGSLITARKWAGRYRAEGEFGMQDRSSKTLWIPGRTSKHVKKKIINLRWRLRLGQAQIAARLGLSTSTVHAVVACCRATASRISIVSLASPCGDMSTPIRDR